MCFDKCVIFSGCGHGYFCIQLCPKSVEHCENIKPKQKFVGGYCESCKSERYVEMMKQERQPSINKRFHAFVARIAGREKKVRFLDPKTDVCKDSPQNAHGEVFSDYFLACKGDDGAVERISSLTTIQTESILLEMSEHVDQVWIA